METVYEAVSAMRPEDALLRQEFLESTMQAREVLRRPEFSLRDIKPTNVIYQKTVKDSEGVVEVWCISQNVGIAEDVQVPELLEEAFMV